MIIKWKVWYNRVWWWWGRVEVPLRREVVSDGCRWGVAVVWLRRWWWRVVVVVVATRAL